MAANCDSCDDEYTQDEFEGVLKPYSFEPKRQDREINVDTSESTSHSSDNEEMAVNEIWLVSFSLRFIL